MKTIDYTTTAQILALKRRGSIPTNQALYSDQDFVDAMTDSQELRIIPGILRTREEFFVTTLRATFVPGNLTYPIPERAIGSRLRQILALDAQGEVLYRLQRLEPETAREETHAPYSGDPPVGFYFEGNKVILSADLTGVTSLDFKYYRRPNRLAVTDDCGKVLSIVGNVIELDNNPFAVDDQVDLISATPGFDSLGDDVEVSGVAGFTITIPSEIAGLLSVGDWVAPRGYSPIPQLPVEVHPIMIQYALFKVLTSLGDTVGAELAAAELASLESNLYEMLDHRDDGSNRKILNSDGIFNTGYRRID